MRTGTVRGTGSETGKGKRMEREVEGEESFGVHHHQERSIAEDQALSFRTRRLFRQEVAPAAGSQQLMAQDPASARRYSTGGRTGHQGRERIRRLRERE